MSTPSWPFDRVAPSQCPRSPHRGPMRGFGRRARGLRCGIERVTKPGRSSTYCRDCRDVAPDITDERRELKDGVR